MPKEYQGPLTGLNVIDFGHYYAGPMVGMLLADQGANVIRIVEPGKKELPEQQYRLLNRNKKLLTLDLKTPEGKTQAHHLIQCADVVIENFRPGVMKRLGLDYASVKNHNPGLVYLSLPGFASTDKERAHIQAWEGVLSAAAGIFTLASKVRERLGFPPCYSFVPLCSVYGAYNGALGVMAALVARQQTLQGTVIEVPLVDAGLFGHSFFLWDPDQYRPSLLPEHLRSCRYSLQDSRTVQLEKLDRAHRDYWSNPYGKFYPCADEREIFIYACYPNVSLYSRRLLKVLGIDEQLKREGFVNAGIWETGLDNNLSDIAGLSAERKRFLMQAIADVLMTRPALEWEDLLTAAGVAAAVIRTREEWLALEPLLASGVFTKMGHGKSQLTVPGRAVDVSGPGDRLMGSFGEVNPITYEQACELVDSEAARQRRSLFRRSEASALKKGDLLRGLKVLDLANMLAGPFCGQFLAEYGAEVIKSDPPLSPAPIFSGKRSIITDVKTAPGREIFNRLVSWADVVIHNILDDTTTRLGATLEALQAINPKVVSCQVSAFGGSQRGGWEKRPGFDNSVQAASGLMVRYGSSSAPQDHGAIACGDVSGGLNLAFAALLAVYQRHETGYAGEGRTSLARMANYFQLPYMIADSSGRSEWGEPHGQFAVGENALQRIYQCRDGWIYVGASQAQARALLETVTGQEEMNEPALQDAFLGSDCGYWLKSLDARGIGCHKLLSRADFIDKYSRTVDEGEADEEARGSSEILYREGVTSHFVSFTPSAAIAPNYVRIGENHSWKRLAAAPTHGQQTREVLRELGYSSEEIAELLHLRVVYEQLPEPGR